MARYFDTPVADLASKAMIGKSTLVYPQKNLGVTDLGKLGYTYIINRQNWSATAALTEDPNISSYWLIEETVPAEAGAGCVTWEMWYGYVPSSYSTYSFEAVTFPGYYDSYDTSTNFRPPYTLVVPVEERHDFMKTTDPVTDFPMYAYQQKELYMNGRGEYVDYVDDATTVQPVGGSRTYTEYIASVAADEVIYIREPISRRAYGTGEIWERVSYRTPAQ